MIKTVREITVFNGKMYVREGLTSDVTELQASKINASAGFNKSNRYHTGDLYVCVDGNNDEYKFEEGSNQWYLQA